jgi:hypothetical protein
MNKFGVEADGAKPVPALVGGVLKSMWQRGDSVSTGACRGEVLLVQ